MARGQRLGFAHWDVEGMEHDVLVGARKTLRRDRPVFTVEVFVHTSSTWRRRNLFTEISQSGYEAFLVEEPCGYTIDCRPVHTTVASREHATCAYFTPRYSRSSCCAPQEHHLRAQGASKGV